MARDRGRTLAPSLRAITRNPSCLISCSHKSPDGGRSALVGKHGGTAVNSRTLYVPGLPPGLAYLSDQSCRCHRGNPPLRAADNNVPPSPLPCPSPSRATIPRDDKSNPALSFH